MSQITFSPFPHGLIIDHVILEIGFDRYMAGYADKVFGRTIQVANGSFHAYTLHEPVGVVAQVVPWNFPLLMMAWKTAPAMAMVNINAA